MVWKTTGGGLRGHADPGVANLEAQLPGCDAPLGGDAEQDSPLAGEFDGVVEQVGKDLPEQVGIEDHASGHAAPQDDIEFEAVFLGGPGERFHHRINQPLEITLDSRSFDIGYFLMDGNFTRILNHPPHVLCDAVEQVALKTIELCEQQQIDQSENGGRRWSGLGATRGRGGWGSLAAIWRHLRRKLERSHVRAPRKFSIFRHHSRLRFVFSRPYTLISFTNSIGSSTSKTGQFS